MSKVDSLLEEYTVISDNLKEVFYDVLERFIMTVEDAEDMVTSLLRAEDVFQELNELVTDRDFQDTYIIYQMITSYEEDYVAAIEWFLRVSSYKAPLIKELTQFHSSEFYSVLLFRYLRDRVDMIKAGRLDGMKDLQELICGLILTLEDNEEPEGSCATYAYALLYNWVNSVELLLESVEEDCLILSDYLGEYIKL